ncbi:hypothetical protein BHU72_07175 [Desulfuribacillus stibiiarsenatis]|uniref:Rhodanese domain-containing protein n=1 Tax=Desulfuribacillus stibiiarsenatis TaxID=1390249 RepID=A0A1E5L4C1_9FIRM|nr:rhodanese-like domain-containing protein [Desulfuribacillus stibiiarsenatis]OEH84965.1 hypothetical protein BHU72_07175 [Desulfuribacillus stibiiarsenatis]
MIQRKKHSLYVVLATILALSLIIGGCSSTTNSTQTPKTESQSAQSQSTGPQSQLNQSVESSPNTATVKQNSEEKPKEIVLQYIKPENVKSAIEKGDKMFLVDIQPEDEYSKHHIKGTIETNAFPVKTNDDKQKLAKVLPDVLASNDPVYIVCPRGKSGAENTFNFLAEQGVANDRLFIIEGGQAAWPYDELLEK